MGAPFRVYKSGNHWHVHARHWPHYRWTFDSPGEAIDYAYRNWPWWP